MRAIKGLKKIGLMPVIVSARGHRRSVRSDDCLLLLVCTVSELRTANDIRAFQSRHTQPSQPSQLSMTSSKWMGGASMANDLGCRGPLDS